MGMYTKNYIKKFVVQDDNVVHPRREVKEKEEFSDNEHAGHLKWNSFH